MWEKKGLRQRNATTTTIAPTGTLSIIAETSSGIEPIFETRYRRTLFGNIEVEVIDPLYEEAARQRDRRSLSTLFKGAFQIPPFRHLTMQQRFQKHVDNGVSKTINLPQGETPDTVRNIYLEAYRLGLKGVTVFRDQSREHQVLSCDKGLMCDARGG